MALTGISQYELDELTLAYGFTYKYISCNLSEETMVSNDIYNAYIYKYLDAKNKKGWKGELEIQLKKLDEE